MRASLNGLLCKTGFTHDQHNNVVVIVYTAYIARFSVDVGEEQCEMVMGVYV